MYLAVSHFCVANAMDEAVREAFRQRPHRVDEAAGFIRMEVANPCGNPKEFWLFTWWRDEASFQAWHRSHSFRDSHNGIPKGLKLEPNATAFMSESFELLGVFFVQHLPTAQAGAVSASLDAARAALVRDDLPLPFSQSRLPAQSQTPRYRKAALEGDNRSALKLVTDLMEAGVSLTEAAVTLVQPAMYQIGQLWQENRISVAQEHLATAVSQNVLARAYMQATFAPAKARRGLFACVQGNQHALGLRILSDAFETEGWEVGYLGADVPVADLIRQVDAEHPDLLALSLSLPKHLDAARASIAQLRAELGGACPEIWIGGLATLNAVRLPQMLAADGWAEDAQHALEQIKT